MSVRSLALSALQISPPIEKCASTATIEFDANGLDANTIFTEPSGLPARLDEPELVSPTLVKQRSVKSPEGRAALIHALAHIELNAVNLGLDILWRFPDLPPDFYRQWLSVAQDEARHFLMLNDHLESIGFHYGHFPAHNGLWEMAEKTKGDLLARLALVPRTLEARGLDASPLIRDKLASVGDVGGAAILDTILRDEIGHVAVGNSWYRWVCQQRGLDPIKTYAELAFQYAAPKLRGPFNLHARRAAGFTDAELELLKA